MKRMSDIRTVLSEYGNAKLALYGLGTETERFLARYGSHLSVVGLLDGFREDGELYGYSILPHRTAIDMGVKLIIVVARPGSCKAIAKRIGGLCRDNNVALFDVRGRDLLAANAVAYDFGGIDGGTGAELANSIKKAEVISFDLFDTLIARKVYSYTDIFELMDMELKRTGIIIPNFPGLRVSAEKELSQDSAPTLEMIYEEVLRRCGGGFISAKELAELEWRIDRETIIARDSVIRLYQDILASGKRVVITTDSYYRKDRIEEILECYGIKGYENIFVSCEYGVSKTGGLFNEVRKLTENDILHIGDDEAADIEMAGKACISSFRIYSPVDLFDLLGGMGADDCMKTLSDRLKVGLFASRLFNDPFVFDEDERRVVVEDARSIGYLFCAPMITDFVLWMKERVREQGFRQILFCARDGYLVGKLYRRIDSETKSVYFLSSRASAIRAGMESEDDISYVDSMKYFGTQEESLKARFGIDLSDESMNRNDMIFKKAREQKKNYRSYIEKLNLHDDKIAMFDFVAKGTPQLYLGRLFDQHMKGFYFLQLEPEFMADKGLDIEPFYSNEEKNASAIFDNYYILETMLTSPYSQMVEFDDEGDPSFADETRSAKDLRCFESAQEGIEEYFRAYVRLLPNEARAENKRLDEVLLSLVNRVKILDEDFLGLKVEDPFFGRMTAITDVIG